MPHLMYNDEFRFSRRRALPCVRHEHHRLRLHWSCRVDSLHARRKQDVPDYRGVSSLILLDGGDVGQAVRRHGRRTEEYRLCGMSSAAAGGGRVDGVGPFAG